MYSLLALFSRAGTTLFFRVPLAAIGENLSQRTFSDIVMTCIVPLFTRYYLERTSGKLS
eukprot:m.261559 g.261559  ORF g.261559 m.261559 type:complete len:59 (+) comp19697_c0_seq5:746-922(+)